MRAPRVMDVRLRGRDDGVRSRRCVMGLLDGKKALIFGVANKRSIAWGIATALQREGAELGFSYAIERLKENVDELVATLPGHEKMPVIQCDVTKQAEIDRTYDEIEKSRGSHDIPARRRTF